MLNHKAFILAAHREILKPLFYWQQIYKWFSLQICKDGCVLRFQMHIISNLSSIHAWNKHSYLNNIYSVCAV